MAGRWVLELLGLPADCSFAFVTGCQMAHVTALAAARAGASRPRRLRPARARPAGAPPLRVVAGGKAARHARPRAAPARHRHARRRCRCPVDDQGRMDVELLEAPSPTPTCPTIVCAQAGEVNTGRLRRPPTHRRRCEAAASLAPRRRRLRAVGRREPALPPSRRRPRRRRLLGDGRPQVAQRPVRLRHRVLRRPGGARGGDGVRRSLSRPVADERGERDPMGLQPRVLAAGPGSSRSRRRSARSAAAASRSSSSELRRGARSSRRASPRSPAARSSTTSCSTRCSSASRRRAHDGDRSRRCRRTARPGRARPCWEGRAAIRILGLLLAHRRRRRRRTLAAFERAAAAA